MTENYELPVLFTEEERKAYASWGIKKEKLLMPFAIATILIYAVTAAFVVMKVWGVRDSDHVLFQMLVLGDWIPELTGKMATETESYPLAQLFAFLNPKDNTICYQKKWYIIGENTIENIYPAKYRHPWMDHPENKASAITDVQRLTDILKGYEASLEAARKEQEWLNNQK